MMLLTARQTTDGVNVKDIESAEYDEPPIDVTDTPRAKLTVTDANVQAYRLAAGKKVLLRRSGERVFPGIITTSTPEADVTAPNQTSVDMVHEGYHCLRRYQCDDYDFDEDGDPSTTRDGVTNNPWNWFIFREPGSTLDAYGNGYPVHGINITDGIRSMVGTRHAFQLDFQDNRFFLASDIYVTTNKLQVYRDGPSGDLRSALQRTRKDNTGFTGTATPMADPTDSSGNGNTLTEVGSPTTRTSPEPKYNAGYDFDSTDDQLTTTSNDFAITGDLSMTFAFTVDDLSNNPWLILRETSGGGEGVEADNILIGFRVLADGSVSYLHEYGAGNNESLSSSAGVVTAGAFHTATVTRNTTTKTVVVKVDGVEAINTTYTNNPTGGSNTLTTRIGANESGILLNGAMYEVRVWDSLVSQTTLDNIADPNDDTYNRTAEGTEIALWYLDDGAMASPKTIDSIPLMNGDPYIRAMGDVSNVDVVLVGKHASDSVSNASHLSATSISAQTTVPESIRFKPDGAKMFVLGGNTVYQYTLSTPGDPATKGAATSFSVATQAANATGIDFSPDGSKMFVIDDTTSSEAVYTYDLGTAWDVTTSVYNSDTLSIPEEPAPTGLEFNDDGTKMFIASNSLKGIREYSLSTAWTVSTGVESDTFSASEIPGSKNCRDIAFSSDGMTVYLVESVDDDVYEYILGAPYDISSPLFVSVLDVSTEDLLPTGIDVSSDGRRFYMVGAAGDDVNMYDITTAPVLELCRDAGDASGAALVNETARTYTSVTLTHTANYNGSTLDAWTGTVDLSSDGATEKGMLGFRIGIEGADGSAATTKLYYAYLLPTTVSDVDLTEGTAGTYSNGQTLVDSNGTTLRGGVVGNEEDWIEGNFLGARRNEAIERIRTTTVSDPTVNTSPHWDFHIDVDLQYHWQERRGTDKTREYSFDAKNLLGVKHIYDGEEVAYQTIAYGAGSGSSVTRIVNKREFSAGGLYDSDRDPTGTPTKVELSNVARVMEFVDSDETSILTLHRKAYAFHKLHRDFIQHFSARILTEFVRFFETGDGVLVKNFETRTNATLRVTKLRRRFSATNVEELVPTFGDPPVVATAALGASQEIRSETLTVRTPQGTGTTGLSGPGYFFDKDHISMVPFFVPPGVERAFLRITTLPWQANAKSTSPWLDNSVEVAKQTTSTGSIADGGFFFIDFNLSQNYVIGEDVGIEWRVFVSETTGATTWDCEASLTIRDAILGNAGTYLFGFPVLGKENSDQTIVTGFIGAQMIKSVGGSGNTEIDQISVEIENNSGGARTFDVQLIAVLIQRNTLKFAIGQFDGATGDGTGPAVFCQDATIAIDPADADGDGIPTTAEFNAAQHPNPIGKAGQSQTQEMEVTGWLDVDASGIIESKVHYLALRGTADATNDNPDGLGVASVTPFYKFRQSEQT